MFSLIYLSIEEMNIFVSAHVNTEKHYKNYY